MKKHLLPALALAAAGLTACFDDSVTEPPPLVPVTADTARNVFANLPPTTALTGSNVFAFVSLAAVRNVANLRADSAGPAFTYFSLTTGAAVADSNAAWDLAFRADTIKVRGGSQLLTATTFEAVTQAPETGYAAGYAPVWRTYTGGPNHAYVPTAGTILVVKTTGNLYAKIQITSYYKNSPATPNYLADTAKYYTFRYVLQPDGSRNLTPAANPAPRTFFSLRTGAVVADSTQQWDIAFRGTSITVNGQAQLVASGFDALTTAPAAGYGASVGTWYNYSGAPLHLITPKADTVIVIKTADNKYAKIQVTSYYKGSPASPGAADTARYYSFKYFLQADGSANLQAGTDAAPKTYFSFQTGTTVASASQQWDIAFRSTTITVNGNSLLLTGANFDALPEAPEAGYSPGDVPAWHDYSGAPNHTVTPKVGGVILIKTADNKYVKLQILSYYQNFPANPVGTTDVPRYYTFRYVYQPNGTRTF